MAIFERAEQMRSVLDETLRRGQDSEAARGLARAGLTVAFAYRNPEVYLLMDGKAPPPGQAIGVHSGDAAVPDVTFALEADVGHRFWSGNLNVPQALARGQIRASGSIAGALKLLPLMPPLYAIYREVMAERGLGDA